jgi:two-component sensor histidine kinase
LQDMGTLGLQLVSTLTRQLNGDVELDRSSGTTVRIGFSQPA